MKEIWFWISKYLVGFGVCLIIIVAFVLFTFLWALGCNLTEKIKHIFNKNSQ